MYRAWGVSSLHRECCTCFGAIALAPARTAGSLSYIYIYIYIFFFFGKARSYHLNSEAFDMYRAWSVSSLHRECCTCFGPIALAPARTAGPLSPS